MLLLSKPKRKLSPLKRKQVLMNHPTTLCSRMIFPLLSRPLRRLPPSKLPPSKLLPNKPPPNRLPLRKPPLNRLPPSKLLPNKPPLSKPLPNRPPPSKLLPNKPPSKPLPNKPPPNRPPLSKPLPNRPPLSKPLPNRPLLNRKAPRAVPKVSGMNFRAKVESEIIELTNEERENNGLSSLQTSENLQAAARIRARELVKAGPKKFAHSRPNGDEWSTVLIEDVPTQFSAAGEKSLDGTVQRQ